MPTLQLGPVTLHLPLVVHDDGETAYVVDAVTEPTSALAAVSSPDVARLFAASPDPLLAAEALLSVLDAHEDIADSGMTGALDHYTNDDAVYEAKAALHTAIARARGQETR